MARNQAVGVRVKSLVCVVGFDETAIEIVQPSVVWAAEQLRVSTLAEAELEYEVIARIGMLEV